MPTSPPRWQARSRCSSPSTSQRRSDLCRSKRWQWGHPRHREEAARMVPRAVNSDRRLVRETFEERFSVRRMVDEHEDLYEEAPLIERRCEMKLRAGDSVRPIRSVAPTPRPRRRDGLTCSSWRECSAGEKAGLRQAYRRHRWLSTRQIRSRLCRWRGSRHPG